MAQSETEQKPQKIWLKDYLPPTFSVENLELEFDLDQTNTKVTSRFQLTRLPNSGANDPIVLDGEGLKLESITLNGKNLTSKDYDLTTHQLVIPTSEKKIQLAINVHVNPKENTALTGLYLSGGAFTTQCEAHGFRHITYFFDRPDVMTNYLVTLRAPQKEYPVLLSNGDCIDDKKLADGRRQVIWKDPHKKPCYLFALVGGDLGVIKDHFITSSKKKVALEIYAPHGQQDRCSHAMESLKKSMKWDEERFGREYDLSTYMIVAMDDFNAGAMENKGLNIFNSRLVLADAASASDGDYFNIESVVAHEYFHNWTGNRVTLRDWFHLSLKEGLTVFRDQEFSMDQSSRSSIRIDTVSDLRSGQFAEDSGANSHPIRPESCYAVDNFYTATIYEKGAEVIRMMQTIVGRPGFRKGMDLYFSRHDGQAVIIEDFAKCIAEANQQDWEQFKKWYSFAGTPHVYVQEDYSAENKQYTLTLTQKGSTNFHIPLSIGLLDQNGRDMNLNCTDINKNSENESILHLKSETQKFVFNQVTEKPVLSLNRGFSAPIHLHWKADDKTLAFVMSHDSDDFNRWDAGQKLFEQSFQNLVSEIRAQQTKTLPRLLVSSLGTVLGDPGLDNSFKAQMLTLPEDSYLIQSQKEFEAAAFLQARETIEAAIGLEHEALLLQLYHKYHGQDLDSKSPKVFGDRRLKNLCLSLLGYAGHHQVLIYDQFKTAKIMTDQMSAFMSLTQTKSDFSSQVIHEFYEKWKDDTLVLNKWFTVQASSTHPDTFQRVVDLCSHPAFNIKNPNRVYSLLWRFGENLVRFHDAKIDAYTFYADKIIEIDRLNPSVAARLCTSFSFVPKLTADQKMKAAREIERLMRSSLSSNSYEIIAKNHAAL